MVLRFEETITQSLDLLSLVLVLSLRLSLVEELRLLLLNCDIEVQSIAFSDLLYTLDRREATSCGPLRKLR